MKNRSLRFLPFATWDSGSRTLCARYLRNEPLFFALKRRRCWRAAACAIHVHPVAMDVAKGSGRRIVRLAMLRGNSVEDTAPRNDCASSMTPGITTSSKSISQLVLSISTPKTGSDLAAQLPLFVNRRSIGDQLQGCDQFGRKFFEV